MRFLYPSILAFATLGVYAVNNSVVDVWIMAVTGLLGYVLRKFDFEIAPIILGLVLAPMIELTFRQSLAMSAGSYAIFFYSSHLGRHAAGRARAPADEPPACLDRADGLAGGDRPGARRRPGRRWEPLAATLDRAR